MPHDLKFFELRDEATCIPIFAIRLSRFDGPIARRAGYGAAAVILSDLCGGRRANVDAYDWGDRTFRTAHMYIEKHWAELTDGQVVDVRVILGETKTPAEPECV